MKRIIKKYISIITVLVLIFAQSGSLNLVNAVPTGPAAPEAPIAPEAPTVPTEEVTAPTAPEAPTYDEFKEEASEPDPAPEPSPEASGEEGVAPAEIQQSTEEPNSPEDYVGSATGEQTGDQNDSGNNGETTINTGDATNNAGVLTFGNNNFATPTCCGTGVGASIINDSNGPNSDNSGSLILDSSNDLYQDNSATVVNTLDQSTNTGDNEASRNNGGDTTINTGDANTTGTIITAVNTNVAGMAVAEFNIVDDQTGDIILDFGAGCVYGCDYLFGTVKNTNNGPDSTNDANLTEVINNNTFQNNDANIENSLILDANSGENTASRNNGGDSIITTGDANVSGNALTLANNNIAGGVIYSVVNIFGDLIGDIIFPEEAMNVAGICSTCGGTLYAANTNNGPDSTNNTDINQNLNNETFQINNADIQNNLKLASTTGDNDVSRNNQGDNLVETGDAFVDVNVLNVANSNIYGGNWWLVIVNEAGNWVGKILGAPAGLNFAGSDGTEFSVSEDGTISAVNNENGPGSNNNASVDQNVNNTLVQTNDIKLNNTLDLSANTGGNEASRNNGGDSKIKTGDAKVIANLVNFVNNNIAGNGKLFVTVVNVFGSWMGDFVTPGTKKEDNTESLAQGGTGPDENTYQGNSNPTQPTQTSNNAPNNTGSGAAAGAAVVSSSNSSNNQAGGILGAWNPIVHVAAFKDKNDSLPQTLTAAEEGAKKIRINAAWALLSLPLLPLLYLNRRKIYQIRNLLKKN